MKVCSKADQLPLPLTRSKRVRRKRQKSAAGLGVQKPCRFDCCARHNFTRWQCGAYQYYMCMRVECRYDASRERRRAQCVALTWRVTLEWPVGHWVDWQCIM